MGLLVNICKTLLLCGPVLMVFRVVAMVVGLCFVLMFFFVPETFWDRTPRPHAKTRRTGLVNLSKIFSHNHLDEKAEVSTRCDGSTDLRKLAIGNSVSGTGHATIAERRQQKDGQHVGFVEPSQDHSEWKNEAGKGLEMEPYVSGTHIELSSTANPRKFRVLRLRVPYTKRSPGL